PKPFPKMSKRLPPAPGVGLIVKWNGIAWADERGSTKWNQFVPYTLSDVDLVVVDASMAAARIQNEITGIGTHIGNAVLDSGTGPLYVANDDAHSAVCSAPNAGGRFITPRVSIVGAPSQPPGIPAVVLNPHTTLDASAGSAAGGALGRALPADIARGADGT